MLSQQTPKDTDTARCHSCRPHTCHGHCRGCWHRQGKLVEGSGSGAGRWDGSATAAQPSRTSCVSASGRQAFSPSAVCPGPLLLRPLQTPQYATHTPTLPLQAFWPGKIHSPQDPPQAMTTPRTFLENNGHSCALGSPGARGATSGTCSLRTLTPALTAIVTRAAAGLPGAADTVALAAPAQARLGPNTTQCHRGQCRGCPEL